MNRLLRLYPARWRTRYAQEMSELLEERPMTVTAGVDLIRGAIDAHRHPELTLAAAVGTDGSIQAVEPRSSARDRGVPGASFLGTLAVSLFLTAAASIVLQDRFPHVAWQVPNALAALGAAALGMAILARSRGHWVAFLGGALLVSGVLTLPFGETVMPSVVTTVTGSVVLVIGSVGRRPPRTVGLSCALAASTFAWAYWGDGDLRAGLIVSLAFSAAAGACIALSGSRGRRPVIAGIGFTVAVVALVWTTAVLTSPRILHDGYALWCGTVARATCIEAVDPVAAELRVEHPGISFTDASVEPSGSVWICAHPVDDSALWPCWNEMGELAGGTTRG